MIAGLGERRGRDRAASETLGLLLLIGMTVSGAAVVFYTGAGLIDSVESDVQEGSAEQTIREFDSRLAEVALSDNLEHTLEIDAGDDQEVRVAGDAEMTVELHEDDKTCTFDLPMGSLHYETEDRSVVTYQGGGIWKETDDGNVMLSSPDMEYRDGTLTYPSVNINGTIEGSPDQLQASKDLEYSEQKSEEYTQTMRECGNATELTVTVQSRYADAWGEYLESEVSENVEYDLDTDDPDERSVTVSIESGIDAIVGDGQNEVVVDENATVKTTLLGAEVSAQGQTWDGTDYTRWYPISLDVLVDGESVDPSWPEDINQRDQIDPAIPDSDRTETFEIELDEDEEVEITMQSTLWGCSWGGWEDAGSDWYEGDYWEHEDCGDRSGQDTVVDATADENPTNVRVLEDDDEMPVLETEYRQRNAEEILGPLLDDENVMQLEDNQVVFLFELTEEDATWEEAIDAMADGSVNDPDYNDVIVLLEIEDEEGKEADDFEIRLSTTHVHVEPT